MKNFLMLVLSLTIIGGYGFVSTAHAFDPEVLVQSSDLIAQPQHIINSSSFRASAKRASSGTASTSSTNSSGISRTLSYGMKKNADVMKLQVFLVQKGYLSTTPDGNFGPMMLAAVKKFQTANGLPALGLVGPQTRALIK